MVYIIGLILAVGLVIFGIVFDTGTGAVNFATLSNFYDLSSMLITVGGTIGVLVMSFPGAVFKDIPKHFKVITGSKKFDPVSYIQNIKEFAEEARKKGLLALEDKVNECEDNFLKTSIMLIVDAIDPDKVKKILDTEIDFISDRHNYGASFYERGGAYAPAFGMIGTLIGLINMLSGEMSDTNALVSGMGIALITTFYGSLIANIFFLPIGAKLRAVHEEEMLCKIIVVEGVISIQAGENPKHIEEKLFTMISENKRAMVQKKGKDSE